MNRMFDPCPIARARRFAVLLIGALALPACSSVVPASTAPSDYGANRDRIEIGTGRDYPRAQRSRSGTTRSGSARSASSSRPGLSVGAAQPGYGLHPSDRACFADLHASGARFSRVPDRYAAPGCNTLGAVKLVSLNGDASQFGVTNLGPVKCEAAKAFSGWARFGVDRAARQILGSPLVRIETMGSYACRNIFGTSRRSAHATGNAIDVSGFVLADGRRIALKRDWNGGTRAEREFLRVVQRSACKRFGTVLGPEYNAAHRDHFHLERSESSFCR